MEVQTLDTKGRIRLSNEPVAKALVGAHDKTKDCMHYTVAIASLHLLQTVRF